MPTYTRISKRTESVCLLEVGSSQAVEWGRIEDAIAGGITAFNAMNPTEKAAEDDPATATIILTPASRIVTVTSTTTYTVDAQTGKIASASTERSEVEGNLTSRTPISLLAALRAGTDGRRSGAAGDGGAIQHTRAEQPDTPDGGQ